MHNWMLAQRGVGRRLDEAQKMLEQTLNAARELSTAAKLGGLDQTLLQSLGTFTRAMINLGPKKGLLLFRNLFNIPTSFREQVIKQTEQGTRKAYEGGVDIGDKYKKYTDKAQDSIDRAYKAARNFTGAVEHFSMLPVTLSDVYSSDRSWVAYYQTRLIELGVTDIDLETEGQKQGEETRQRAVAYAQAMVNKTQVASNANARAPVSKSEAYSILRNLFFQFSTFNFNQKTALLRATHKLKYNLPEGAKELSGVVAEVLVFNAVKIALATYYYDWIKDQIKDLFGFDEDEEDEEKKSRDRFTDWKTRVALDLFPAHTVGVLEEFPKMLMNRINYNIQRSKGYEGAFQEFMADDIETYFKKQRALNTSGARAFGQYSQPIETGTNLIEWAGNKIAIADDKPVFVENDFSVRKLEPTSELAKINQLLFYIELLNYTPFPKREVTNQMRKVHREELKKYPLTLEKYSEEDSQ